MASNQKSSVDYVQEAKRFPEISQIQNDRTNAIFCCAISHYVLPYFPRSIRSNLSELLPRLWPFLYHSSGSVRNSALKTLETLTSSERVTDGTSGPALTVQVQGSAAADGALQNTGHSDQMAAATTNLSIKVEAKLELRDSLETNYVCAKVGFKSERMEITESEDTTTKVTKEKTGSSEVEKENIMSGVKKVECPTDQGELTVKSEVAVQKANESNSALVKDKFQEGRNTVAFFKKDNMLDPTAASHCAGDGRDGVSEPPDISSEARTNVESPCCDWIRPIIQPALTHIYQRALLEQDKENLELVFKVRTTL